MNRNFVITELDKKYVDIAQRNLSKIQSDMYGTLIYERDSVFKPQINGTPRKHIEKAYMQLCFTDNKTYSKEELKLISPLTYSLIENYSGDFNKLQAATKRKMEASLFLVE